MTSGSDFVNDWLADHAESLNRQARSAGLLSHGSLVGQVREFLVSNFLKSFLPECVEIGTGRVFDSQGNRSKQIDIVLYDSRCPALRFPSGVGQFPIEGVIATIEVKSSLSSKQAVGKALDNCHSVMACQLAPSTWSSSHPIIEGLLSTPPSHRYLHEVRDFASSLLPATYVFSFRGTDNAESLRDWVKAWYQERGHPMAASLQGIFPSLPRLILAGKTMAFFNDVTIKIDGSDDQHGNPVTMVFGPFSSQFEFFASHILSTISRRFELAHADAMTVFDLKQYNPLSTYTADVSKSLHENRQLWHGLWVRQSVTSSPPSDEIAESD
tara:strand:+ start:85147 stop:86124 length:978 start_codon:yes stop_codon:yes gene_type:complete